MTDTEIRRKEYLEKFDEHRKCYFPEAWKFFKSKKDNICGFLYRNIDQENGFTGRSWEAKFDSFYILQVLQLFPASVYLDCDDHWGHVEFCDVTDIDIKRYRPTVGGWPIVITCGGTPTSGQERKHIVIALRAEDWQI